MFSKLLCYIFYSYVIIVRVHSLNSLTDNRIHSKTLQLSEGSKAIITCKSVTNPTWTHNGDPLNIVADSVIIESIKRSDSGVYICNGITSAGKTHEVTKVLVVIVTDNKRLLPSLLRARIGKVARFKCDSNSSVMWKYNGGLLRPNTYITSHNNSLVFKNIALHNAGKYECQGTYSVTDYVMFTAKGELRVYDQGRISPSNQRIYEEQNAYIHCSSSTIPFWLHNGGIIPPNAKPTRNGLLKITRPEHYNGGSYECLGTTKHQDVFYANSLLTVLLKNQNKVHPSKRKANLGDHVRFMCLSDKDVAWLYNDDELPENVMLYQSKDTEFYWLTIPSVKPYNYGSYECQGIDLKNNYSFYATALLEKGKVCTIPGLNTGTVQSPRITVGDTMPFCCKTNFESDGCHSRESLPDGKSDGGSSTCKHFKNNAITFVLHIFIFS